ncbi:MAG: fucose isomerase [Oscillospiraceae bacterium]|nr:fucose isomerase [Oscillospiraceae bacterium]
MIHLGKDVKLNVCPILVTLHHDYVFEGPCRMGKDFELTKEFDDMANAELIKGAHEELAENLTSPHFNVMEPIWIDRNEEFLVTPEILDKMLQGKDDVDIYMIGPMGRLSDLVIDFVQKAKKPIITIPGPQCMQTILIASTRARGLESYAYRTWKETLDFLEVLRVKKMLRETRVLCAARFGTARSVSDMGNFVNLEQVTDVLGTQFTFVNLHELIDQTHIGKSGDNYTLPGRAALNPTEEDVKEMEALADDLIGNAVECDMERKEILNSERFYVTVKKMLDYYGCNAFAAPCPDACATRRLNQERMTFCLAHSLLGEMGIPSACEYDIPACLSIAILSCLADKPAYMGNTTHDAKAIATGRYGLSPFFHTDINDACMDVVKADPDNVILTWHAVPRRNMQGWDAPKAPYAIRPFAASGFGVTLRYDFNRDVGQEITMCRISPDCKTLFVAKGEIVGGVGFGDYSCSEGVFFRVKDGNDFFQKQLEVGNHVPLVYGDCFDQVCALGKHLGLQVITA